MKIAWIFLGALMGCGNLTDSNSDPRSNIIGYGDEKTLAEQYGLNVRLPIKFTALKDLLRGEPIHYELVTDSHGRALVPMPRFQRSFPVDSIALVYRLTDTGSFSGNFGRHYLVYLDKHQNVILIENAFEYSG